MIRNKNLALSALATAATLVGAQAFAAINVPVTTSCNTTAKPVTYKSGTNGSSTISSLFVSPAKMTPCYTETNLGSSEPYIAIRKDGTLIYAPVHFPNGDLGVMRSTDQGDSWTATVPRLPDGKPHGRVQPFMFMDPVTERLFFHTSKASFVPINLTFGFDQQLSDDGGQTWRYQSIDNIQALDWAKIYNGPARTSEKPVGYPHVLYMSAPTPISTPAVLTGPKEHVVMKSLDGGKTWNKSGGFSIDQPDSNCSGLEYILMGSGAVAPDGTVYIAGRRCTQVGLAVSKDDGKTWTLSDVPNTSMRPHYTVAQIPFNPNYVLTQPITIDGSGNMYVLYPDAEDLLRLTVSRDKGRTWTKPVVISAPGIQRVHLAALTVKAPGKIAIGYYGTDKDNGGNYNAYVAESVNALTTTPTFRSVTVNNPSSPLHAVGFDANYFGMFIGGDLAEITQLQYAPSGDLYISLIKDMCPDTLTCTWDFKGHFNSKYQAALGRIKH